MRRPGWNAVSSNKPSETRSAAAACSTTPSAKSVSSHRRRGALVQVLDDGGLENVTAATLDTLLNDAAHRLEPVHSSRIIIRTGQPDSGTAITIVASTPDETAAALGLDADDEVDLWYTIPYPDTVTLAA